MVGTNTWIGCTGIHQKLTMGMTTHRPHQQIQVCRKAFKIEKAEALLNLLETKYPNIISSIDEYYTVSNTDTTWYYVTDSTYKPIDNHEYSYNINNRIGYLEFVVSASLFCLTSAVISEGLYRL